MKKALLFVGLLLAAIPAYAASTVNPSVPGANSPLASAPIRANFAAANNDINNLLAKFGSLSSPANPTTFQDWVNTGTTPYTWNIYDGAQWIPIGTIDVVAHRFTPVNAAGCTFANPTAIIGATAVNGTATTCMRSDAAPKLPSVLPALDGSLLTNLTPGNLGAPVPTSLGGLGANNGAASGIPVFTSGTSTVTAATGTGAPVLATSPTLVTPNLGTPSAVNLANGTNLTPSTGLNATGTPSSTTYLRGDNTWQTISAGGVTSVGQTFTGGLISVSGSPITSAGTLALTVAGTSGGIPYFSSASTWASSAALTANAIVLGGGAGSAPTVLGSLGTTTTVLHGNAAGAPTFAAVSLTADVSGILPAANGGAGTVSGIMQANGSGTVAAATIGNGLSYSAPALSLTNTLNAQTGTSYAVASTDAAKIVLGSNAGAIGYTIVQANTAGFTSGYGTTIANINTPGGTNITTTATISKFGNNLTTLVLAPGQVADIGSNGTDYPFTAMSLPVMAVDTVLGNFSGTSNYPIAGALSSCSATTNAVTYNTSTHAFGCNSNLAVTNASQTFSGEQRNGITTLTISTATFTPNNANNNYKIGLTSACPCTIANPTTVTAGAAGVIEIDQDATGSRTVGTWGSDYIAAGGVAALTLSTAANAKDFFSYLVLDSTHILVTPAALNATH